MADNLETICNFAFPSNHLLTFQLVRDLEKTASIKPEYFFFLTLAPGASGEGRARTYDFNQKMNVKYAVYEMSGLAFALKQYAMGNGSKINYAKFAKSANSTKTVSLSETVKQQDSKDGIKYVRNIQFRVTVSNMTQSVSLTVEQAYALGDSLDLMHKKAADLEFNRTANNTNFNSYKAQNTQGARTFNQPTPNSGSNSNSVTNISNKSDSLSATDMDDNSNFLNGGFNNFGVNPF